MSRRHYRPFLKTVAATLVSSGQIVGQQMRRGAVEPAFVDDVIHRWSERIFRYGQGTLTGYDAERYEDARPDPQTGRGGRAYVVMSNHQSLLDIPSIIGTFPGRVRMVSKKELGQVPIWGQAMRAAGVVFVDRANRDQSIAALERAKAQLADGTSIWIAPEGTRSRGGVLGPFKKGGFHLARQLGVDIAPAWITGTAEIVSPESFGVTLGGRVTVRYGAPIPTVNDDGPVDLLVLMARVREALETLRAS